MRKINAKGFAHQMAIMAVIVVAVIGSIGSYIYLNSSSAAIASVSKNDCGTLLGRSWKKGKCSKVCDNRVAKPGRLITANPYDYCSNAASKLSKSICTKKHRVYKYGVCMKEWARQRGAVGYTVACKPHSYKYHVANPYDYCSKR